MDNGAIREGEPPYQAPTPMSDPDAVPSGQTPASPSGCIPWVCGLFCIFSWLAVLLMLGGGAIAGIIVWLAHGDVILLCLSLPFFGAVIGGTTAGFGFALIATLGAFTLRMGKDVRLLSALALAIHLVCFSGILILARWMDR